MAGINKIIATLLILTTTVYATGQITSGKIVFERKTNLLKKFDEPRMKEMFKDNKTKIDVFELFFNDTASVFKPVLSDEVDQMSWVTNKNTVYQDFNKNEKLSILDLWGNQVFVTDSVSERTWKITDSKRNIGNYNCTKAIWQKNDTTRIYAWFTTDIVASVGPEVFNGLPGAILGLATEDGGIIYFATEVVAMEPTKEQLNYNLKKNDVYTMDQLKKKIEEDFGNQPWGKRLFVDLFRWQ